MGKLLAISLLTTMAAAALFQPILMGKPREQKQARSDGVLCRYAAKIARYDPGAKPEPAEFCGFIGTTADLCAGGCFGPPAAGGLGFTDGSSWLKAESGNRVQYWLRPNKAKPI